MSDARVILVSGDRHATASIWDGVIHAFVRGLTDKDIVIHGGCRGIDTMIGVWALGSGLNVVRMDAPWHGLGKGAGPVRNERMVLLARKLGNFHVVSPHVFHDNLGKSQGTADMLSRMLASHWGPVLQHKSDGSVVPLGQTDLFGGIGA